MNATRECEGWGRKATMNEEGEKIPEVKYCCR